MNILSKSSFLLLIIDVFIIGFSAMLCFCPYATSLTQILLVLLIPLLITITFLASRDFYKKQEYSFKDTYKLLEATFLATFTSSLAIIPVVKGFSLIYTLFNFICIFAGILIFRVLYTFYKSKIQKVKKILIVGAGQDGKLIAEEIQARPYLKMQVVGFLDDNMSNIEEEDSSIPILGLTYDSEAVIKDNNIDMVIIAVKSRMDSNILTDLAKGIPLGVKVWRMPTFYAYITHKLFTSKMAVNWLFYDYVRPKHIVYSYIKRFLDVILSVALLILTLPVSIISIIGIKLSDITGPIFFTQTRIGKFGRPFKMIKFRTMYQDKVQSGFDDDLEDVGENDNRVMPFCKWMRKFHIDDIPQLLNVFIGNMSLIGPRPVREDVDLKNNEKIRFWECRNWVRPGWTGWQQINSVDCIPEERLGYDLYYVKHRTLIWEFTIFIKAVLNIVMGK